MNGGEVIFHFKGDDKDLDKKTSDISSKFSKMGGTIGKAFLKGTAIATTAMTGLIGASVKGFSEMEQLSGGAKKIFDEMDYSKIEKDATDAYKNMNMSAQEYLTAMNNVGATFASTMGDQKGYDTAKKGLQAISDYATGTGADINLLSEKYKMITRSTSSYLSIADQFAGLLPQTTDGFLKQAQASGFLSKEYKKLTDVPVAEYQQAITNMLEQGVNKMGLLGNTSAEAEKTISGSFLATKSALSNFISGAGSIDDVISSMTNLGNNIVKAIVEMAPKIISGLVQIVNALIPQIPILIQTLVPPLLDGIINLIDGIVNVLPTLLDQLLQSATYIVNTIAQKLPELYPKIISAILGLIPIITNNLPMFLNAVVQLLTGIANGLINSMPIIIDMLPQIIEGIYQSLITLLPLIANVGILLTTRLLQGILQELPHLISKLPTIWYGIFRALKNGLSGASSIGRNLIVGLWNGIGSKVDWILGKIRSFGRSVINAVKRIFGVHSPSKEFAIIGKFNMMGLEEGMESMQPDLQKSIDGMFDLSPSLYGSTSTNLSPQVNVINNVNVKQDSLGQVVNDIKTFAGGSKNDYNYGMA